MVELPLLQEMKAEVLREAVIDFLRGRFGEVPAEIRRLLADVKTERQLKRLPAVAGKCKSFEDFKGRLLA